MTLLTKITNEAINENLEKRWKNGEIYASVFKGKEIRLDLFDSKEKNSSSRYLLYFFIICI